MNDRMAELDRLIAESQDEETVPPIEEWPTVRGVSERLSVSTRIVFRYAKRGLLRRDHIPSRYGPMTVLNPNDVDALEDRRIAEPTGRGTYRFQP